MGYLRSLFPHNPFQILCTCIFLYSLCGILEYYLPMAIINATRCICGFSYIMIPLLFRKPLFIGRIATKCYKIMIFWSFLITMHMVFIDDIDKSFLPNNDIKTWLNAIFGSMQFLPNMIPLILLVPPKEKSDFTFLWRIMWLMCIIYLLFLPISLLSMLTYDFNMNSGKQWGEEGTYGGFITYSTLGIASITPPSVMIYFKKYLNVRWLMYIIAFGTAIFIGLYMARRGRTVIYFLYIISAWWIYTASAKKHIGVKNFIYALIFLLLLDFIYDKYSDSVFSLLLERGLDDSRTGVEVSFFKDMDLISWIFGRGWFGTYYEPSWLSQRASIETGYLALVLRGGLIYLIPYVLLLAITFYQGYYKSNNIFCKSLGMICFIQILSLYPSGWPDFNYTHFMIWLGVWICNTPYFRELSNHDIKKNLFNFSILKNENGCSYII